MHDAHLKAARPLMDYKLKALSLLSGGAGAKYIGELDTAELRQALDKTDLAPYGSVSRGFSSMSELWVTSVSAKTGIEGLIWNAGRKMARLASRETGIALMLYRAVIDTTDNTSCILPHCDSYFGQRIGLRVHLPITSSLGSLGVTFHPRTLDANWWRLSVGKVYAFNNLDPHTVTKLDGGTRSHLICDLLPASVARLSEELLMKHNVGTAEYSELNCSIQNFEMRNGLELRYAGLSAVSSFAEQVLRSDQTKAWLQREAKSALERQAVVSL